MSTPPSPRIAFLHTGAVVIPPVAEQVRHQLPDITTVNYLDDRIVADLSDPERRDSVRARVADLVDAAKRGGAEAVMLTCSSISELAAPVSEDVGIPVLRIDEAMADEAVQTGRRIAVIATLPTTCAPTARLIQERAALAGREVEIVDEVVPGAFEAVSSGDRATHDRLVGDAIRRLSDEVEVIVLAQASMAGAASAVEVEVPVLTSIERGIRRLAQRLHTEV